MQANNLSGLYIVVDGIIGVGKSTQLPFLLDFLRQTYPDREIVVTREPGGTPEAEKIRQDVKHNIMEPAEEVAKFAQARTSTIAEVVKPALQRGAIVVSDRSLTTSLSYQAFGREVGLEEVWNANQEAMQGVYPDLVVYFDINTEVALQRSAGENPDKFDQEDRSFWERTKEGFEKGFNLLNKVAKTKILRISDPDGKLSVSQTTELLISVVRPEIDNWIENREGMIVKERQR